VSVPARRPGRVYSLAVIAGLFGLGCSADGGSPPAAGVDGGARGGVFVDGEPDARATHAPFVRDDEAGGGGTSSTSSASPGDDPSASLDDGSSDAAGSASAEVDAGMGPWQQVATGEHRTCAISAGRLYCWGHGDDTFGGQASFVERPAIYDDEGGWQSIALGRFFACGVRSGELYCWGRNDLGQLGLGDTEPRDAPTRVGTADDWARVGAQSEHACGLGGDRMYCWGYDTFGQLGRGPSEGGVAYSPQAVVGEGGFTALAVGSSGTCGLRGDALYCWGNGVLLRPARSGFTGSPEPVLIDRGIDAVALGGGKVCAGKAGDLYCWGRLWFSWQTEGPRYQEEMTPFGEPGGWSTWALSSDHLCGVRDGVLLCYGYGTGGKLGQGDTTERHALSPVGEADDWEQVAVSDTHSCGLRRGHLYCWGENQFGQLGQGDFDQRTLPVRVEL